MKTSLILVVLLFTVASIAQQRNDASEGVIYGVVVGQDSKPARRIGIVAWETGLPGRGLELQGPPNRRLTNQNGEYRFEHLTLGTYAICVDDDGVGYTYPLTCADEGHSVKVSLTVEHPEAEVGVALPSQDGFLDVEVTNSKNGVPLPEVQIETTWATELRTGRVKMTWNRNGTFLVPPDRDILLHISAPGFQEWRDSVGAGKTVRLHSGTRLKLDVQLAPLKE